MARFSVEHVEGILLVGNAVEPFRFGMARSRFRAFWYRMTRAVKIPFFYAAMLQTDQPIQGADYAPATDRPLRPFARTVPSL
jgi:hypothetical protein